MKTSRIALVIVALILGIALLALADDYLHYGYVTPTLGTPATVFTYYAYWNGPGTPPTAYVHIDAFGSTMMDYVAKVDEDHIYKYETTLATGNHAYYFSDSLGGRHPNVGALLGPEVE